MEVEKIVPVFSSSRSLSLLIRIIFRSIFLLRAFDAATESTTAAIAAATAKATAVATATAAHSRNWSRRFSVSRIEAAARHPVEKKGVFCFFRAQPVLISASLSARYSFSVH